MSRRVVRKSPDLVPSTEEQEQGGMPRNAPELIAIGLLDRLVGQMNMNRQSHEAANNAVAVAADTAREVYALRGKIAAFRDEVAALRAQTVEQQEEIAALHDELNSLQSDGEGAKCSEES